MILLLARAVDRIFRVQPPTFAELIRSWLDDFDPVRDRHGAWEHEAATAAFRLIAAAYFMLSIPPALGVLLFLPARSVVDTVTVSILILLFVTFASVSSLGSLTRLGVYFLLDRHRKVATVVWVSTLAAIWLCVAFAFLKT
ncbi:hypothetical protein [Actinoplanes regularis]|uniref:hypothetical protein n=1 Tax=Actinoplanes regularis TaxID=52697 RepID=UPI00255488FA|nr:hypothetical protein [Actinoplanes regularis]